MYHSLCSSLTRSQQDSPFLGTTASQVHERVHPVGDAVGDSGDDHAAVAVADEDEIVGVGLDGQGRQDVGHVVFRG